MFVQVLRATIRQDRLCNLRHALAFALALLVLLLHAAPAIAHNVDGKLGVGFEETLNGVGGRRGSTSPLVRAAGLSVRYYVGNLGLEAIAGAGLHFPGEFRDKDQILKTATAPAMETTGFLSLGVLYNVFRAPAVNLAVGARVLAGWSRFNALSRNNDGVLLDENGKELKDANDKPITTPAASSSAVHGIEAPMRLGVALELPLRVEFFFSPAFAIAAAVGPVLALNGSQQNPLTGGRNSLDLDLTRGDFSGGLGFSYYF